MGDLVGGGKILVCEIIFKKFFLSQKGQNIFIPIAVIVI